MSLLTALKSGNER